MPDRSPTGHPPWIIVWYAPKHGILQIAAIPRAGRLAAVRDTLLAGIRRSGTVGAPLELLVDAAQLHREVCEVFPTAKAVVYRDPALEYALRSPPALAVLADLARNHLRGRLSVVDGGRGAEQREPSPSPKVVKGASERAKPVADAPATDSPVAPPTGARILRLVPTPDDSAVERAVRAAMNPQVSVAASRPGDVAEPWRLDDGRPDARESKYPRHDEDHGTEIEEDARSPRELLEALDLERHALATTDFALEAVAIANLSLVLAFHAWDDGHVHRETHDHDDDEQRPLDLILELLATHQCATVATMNAEDVERVLFEYLPEHADYPPDQATEIVGELQRFARFLEFEAGHRLSPAIRRLLNQAAIPRLQAVLDR